MRKILLFMMVCSTSALHAVSVTIDKIADAACGNPLGSLIANASGGVGPYTYQWSNGITTPNNDLLVPGTYSVTVTDVNNDQASTSADILFLPSHPWPTGSGYGFRNCPGSSAFGIIDFDQSGVFHGPAPHTITGHSFLTFPGGTAPGEGWFLIDLSGAAPGEQFTIDWQDAFGCPGSTPMVPASLEWVSPEVVSLSSTPACNGNNGSIHGTFTHVQQQYTGYKIFNAASATVASGADNNDFGPMQVDATGLAAGGYWIVFDPDAEDLGMPVAIWQELACADSFYVEVEDHSGLCGEVSGRAFFDHDQDCVADANEPGIPDRVITIQPGNELAYTNYNGSYAVNLSNGNYTFTLQGSGVDLFPLCPATPDASVIVNGSNITQSFADSSLIDLDLAAHITGGSARPGFVQNLWLQVDNLSGQVSGPLEVTLSIDPLMSFISASQGPTNVTGNTLTWSGLDPLAAFAHQWLHVWVQVPPDINLIDQPFTHTVSVTQPSAEASSLNNAAAFSGIVTGSVDPNDKTARTSSGLSTTQYFTDQDEWIDYVIRFQNTGTDTAFTVVVKDTISEMLDLATFEQGIASHGFQVRFKPDRVVEWRFDDILLPDSGTNEAASHGQVTFRIRPVLPVPIGSALDNAANIYFDYNPPVRTNTASLVAESSTNIHAAMAAIVRVAPDPVKDRLYIFGSGQEPLRARISAMDGRTVMEGGFQDGWLDVSSLPPGLYGIGLIGATGPIRLAFVKE